MGATTATSYISVEEVSSDFNTNMDDERYSLLESSILAAEDMIGEYCDRSFKTAGTADVPVVRSFNVQECDNSLFVGDYVSLTNVEITEDEGVTWTPVEWSDRPQKRRIDSIKPFNIIVVDENFPTHIRKDTVRITGILGWSIVPDGVKQATRLQAGEIFGLLEEGTGTCAMHPEAKMLLQNYRSVRF